jgi:excisionase family DNA binding protein
MTIDTFTPQEAAIATGASLPLVQKLVTSKQIPTAGNGNRRRLSRAAVLAIALSRKLPRGVKMSPTEAHEHLAALGDESLNEMAARSNSARPESTSRAPSKRRLSDWTCSLAAPSWWRGTQDPEVG